MAIYHHLNAEERATIILELDRGTSIRAIAEQLDRSPSTVSIEIKRNGEQIDYCARTAAKSYALRRERSVKPKKLVNNELLWDRVETTRVRVGCWLAFRLDCGFGDLQLTTEPVIFYNRFKKLCLSKCHSTLPPNFTNFD